MRTPTSPTISAPLPRLAAAKQEPSTDASIFLRVGLPAGLAMVAAGLNMLAVRQQLATRPAYAFARDLPAGVVLTPEHLEPVAVAGAVDISMLVTADELPLDQLAERIRSSGGQSNDLPILSHAVTRGELVTKGALGGRGTVQPGANEELIQVPRSLIRGQATDLRPGQLVHFLIKNRSEREAEPIEIGPFRVATEQRLGDQKDTQPRRDTICLIYALDAHGQRTAMARLLQRAVFDDGSYALAVIEKPWSSRNAKWPTPQPAVGANQLEQSTTRLATAHQ